MCRFQLLAVDAERPVCTVVALATGTGLKFFTSSPRCDELINLMAAVYEVRGHGRCGRL